LLRVLSCAAVQVELTRSAANLMPTDYTQVIGKRLQPSEALTKPLPVALAGRVILQTVSLHLPLLRNPNKLGFRTPVGFGKFGLTFRELKSQFSGFNVSVGLGWCAEDGIWDPYLRVDFDMEVTPNAQKFLLWWREILRDRFAQRSIYMAMSSPLKWIC
jgi:hypothetical protein